MPPSYLFDLDQLGPSRLLLLTFVGAGFLAWLLYRIGLVGLALKLLGLVVRGSVGAGFGLWRRWLAWAHWPVFLGLVLAVLALDAAGGWSAPAVPLVCGAALLFLGVTACLAYVFIDLERYDVARGYKALHNPLPGQAPAENLVRYGGQVGAPLLGAAALAAVTGFALLNQGLYGTVGGDWYRLGEHGARPDFADFLAYPVLNLFGVVNLLHAAGSRHYVPVMRSTRPPLRVLQDPGPPVTKTSESD